MQPRLRIRTLLLAAGLALRSAIVPAEAPTHESLAAHGIEGPAAEVLLAAFAGAAREELPAAALRARLDEGLAKDAGPAAVAEAVVRRLEMLRQARELLSPDADRARPEPHEAEAALVNLARALESGVPAEVFADVFPRGRGAFSPRAQALVEAAERLHLAGVGADAVAQFLRDALDRELRRMEALRAAEFWIRRHREGVAPEDIRRALWGARSPGAGRHDDEPGRGPHRRRRNQ